MLISLSAVMLVPSPAFRSMAIGIMVSVLFVLAATLTLLPAVLAKLGPRIDKLALPWAHSGEHRSPRFARWGELLWRRPFVFGGLALVALLALALPILGMKTGMPSIKVVPKTDSSRVGYQQISAGFGPGAPGTLQVTAPRADSAATTAVLSADRGIEVVSPAVAGTAGAVLIQAVPTTGPSTDTTSNTIDRLRADLPAAALLGGPSVENHDLETSLASKTPLAIGVILVPRLPAAADRLPGTVDRCDRGSGQPALDRSGVRRRHADLSARPPLRPSRIRIAGLSSTPGGRSSSSR